MPRLHMQPATSEIKSMFRGIYFSPGALGRFRFWNQDHKNPRGLLYHLFVTGRRANSAEVQDILGVTYNPGWAYVINDRAGWLFAVEAAGDERPSMPAVFPLPLPECQIAKSVLLAFREHYADEALAYGDVALSFERGRFILREEAEELIGEPLIHVPDQHNLLTEDGTAILVAKGPVRKQETDRDFDPCHYFAPYEIVDLVRVSAS